jgi:hypothetical protein
MSRDTKLGLFSVTISHTRIYKEEELIAKMLQNNWLRSMKNIKY